MEGGRVEHRDSLGIHLSTRPQNRNIGARQESRGVHEVALGVVVVVAGWSISVHHAERGEALEAGGNNNCDLSGYTYSLLEVDSSKPKRAATDSRF